MMGYLTNLKSRLQDPNFTCEMHVDYETYSEANLKDVGAYKYMVDPSTELLLSGFAIDHDPVYAVDHTDWNEESEEVWQVFLLLLQHPGVKIKAFNAMFEFLVAEFLIGVAIPIERYECVMVHAWSLSFSGGLGDVGAQIGLSPSKQKMARGKTLIQRFCKPAPSNHKKVRYDRHNSPEEWKEFREYHLQDIIAERELDALIRPYAISDTEKYYYCVDHRVNFNGIPIDLPMVNAAISLRNIEVDNIKARMNELTGLKNANSNTQLKEWMHSRGVHLDNLQAETVRDTVAEMPDCLEKDILIMGQKSSKTSLSKYTALKRVAVPMDGIHRFIGGIRHAGAQRTKRATGFIFNPLNIARPKLKHPENHSEIIVTRDLEAIRTIYGDPIQFLQDQIRCAIAAQPGKIFAIADLGSIESRVLGWFSGCRRINDIFAAGLDTYKDFASELFGIPYEDVTKEQRNYSKPPTLGCLAEGTLVLTDIGWWPIEKVDDGLLVWDGEEFVSHGGSVCQGKKEVIYRYWVEATPDHLFLEDGEWVEFRDVHKKRIEYIGPDEPEGESRRYLAVTYDIVNAGPRNRFTIQTSYGHAIVHNCGYQLGAAGLVAYAKGMGVIMTLEEAQRAVDVFRSAYPEVKAMWYWLTDTCMDVIRNYGTVSGYGVTIWRDDNFLFIKLPSGRCLHYYKPLVEMRVPPWGGNKRATVTYMGMSQYSKKWERLTSHGGKFTEQMCIAEGTELLTDEGWKPIERYREGVDRLWDGEEWVYGGKLIDNGRREVVECFGVLMTHDHRVLTESGWAKAEEVIANGCGAGYKRKKVWLHNCSRERRVHKEEVCVANTLCVRKRMGSYGERVNTVEGSGVSVLRVHEGEIDSRQKQNPRYDEAPRVRCVPVYASEVSEPKTPRVGKLWWSGHQGLQKMGEVIRKLLGGHGAVLHGGEETRANGQRRELYEKQLPVEDVSKARQQSKRECQNSNAAVYDDGSASFTEIRGEPNNHILPNIKRVAGGQTIDTRRPVAEGHAEKVYDIADVGPRNRFTVRGCDGEPLIVHNCQGFARDIHYDALGLIDTHTDFKVILHVYDEIVMEVWQEEGELALRMLKRAYTKPRDYAPGLLLGVDGFLTKRYTKD